MNCNNCNATLEDLHVHWAFDLPYCEECHSDLFTYCSTCDSLIYRSEACHNDNGDAFCSECFENDYDQDCPDNPDVDDSDRELIIRLSRNWLQGKVDNRRFISINDKDHYLQVIKSRVGLVENPIYVFGLVDRYEYQISASSDLFEAVQKYTLINLIPATVVSTPGCNRLGISLSIRKDYQKEIIELIRSITTVQETVPALIQTHQE